MTEALKASFASWEKEQERLGIPKGNNYISSTFFSLSTDSKQDTQSSRGEKLSFKSSHSGWNLLLLSLRRAAQPNSWVSERRGGGSLPLCYRAAYYLLDAFVVVQLLFSFNSFIFRWKQTALNQVLYSIGGRLQSSCSGGNLEFIVVGVFFSRIISKPFTTWPALVRW